MRISPGDRKIFFKGTIVPRVAEQLFSAAWQLVRKEGLMKMWRAVLKVFLFVTMFLTGPYAEAQQTRNVSPGGNHYFLYTPPGYPSDGPYPLLVSLHGQVGIGNSLDEILNSQDHSPAKLIHLGRWPEDRPFIVLSPQLKRDPSIPDTRDQNWDPKEIDEVIEHVRSRYEIDGSRIYFVGLSLGATGVWLYSAAYPHKVAAMVPMSGVPDSTTGCFVKDIPSWVFHGEGDGLIVPRFATGMVNAINNCQPNGRYISHLTMMEARRHDGLWSDVYNYTSGHRVFEWLLKFRKNDHGNKAPYVHAGNDIKMIKRTESLYLQGYYFDADGTISKVEWVQTHGPPLHIQSQQQFLKINSPSAGQFEFELRVTDNDGAVETDRVQVEIFDDAGDRPRVTDLVLINKKNDGVVGKLRDGYVINPGQLGSHVFNIRAEANAAALSVRFRISDDHNTRTTNTPGPFYVTGKEWDVREGHYLVCATPFEDRGARGNTGISLCYKIIVSSEGGDPPDDGEIPTHFYCADGNEISRLSSWKSNPDGSGQAPVSFTATGQTFEIHGEAFLNQPLTLGTNSKVVIAAGGKLHLNNRLDGALTVDRNGTLVVNSGHPVFIEQAHAQSDVILEPQAVRIPDAVFGNLTLHGNGTAKSAGAGITVVRGDLTIADDTPIHGHADDPSSFEVSGNMVIQEDDQFTPEPKIGLIFTGPGAQQFSFHGQRAVFEKLVVSAGTTLRLTSLSPSPILETGSVHGGGLRVQDDALLIPGVFNLKISEAGTLNGHGEKGTIQFQNSELIITSTAAQAHHLIPSAAHFTLKRLEAKLSATGRLVIHSPLKITGHVSMGEGTMESNGNLWLTANNTHASFIEFKDNGKILGDVVVDLVVPGGGSRRRLISMPVDGVAVSQLQEFIPVTGPFDGASGNDPAPSLFEYNPADDTWDAYPAVSHDETFVQGKGYAVEFPDSNGTLKISVTGEVSVEEDFIFELVPNGSGDVQAGWNLVGNPFTRPLLWGDGGITSTGISNAAYVLDDAYPGRYLVWDGEVGDPEFGGLIARGQGFFIRTTGPDASLTIAQTALRDTTAGGHRPMSSEPRLTITLSQGELSDRAYVRFSSAGTDATDDHDAVKMWNTYFNLSTLSADGDPLAINRMSETLCGRRLPVSVRNTPPGEFRLNVTGSVFDQGLSVRLVDSYTGDSLRLGPDEGYTFRVDEEESSFGDDRFVLLFFPNDQDPPTVVQDGQELVSSAATGNQWLLNGSPIEGATGQSYTPHLSGDYSVRVTEGGCTWASTPVSFVVTSAERTLEEFSLYPNPASREIRLDPVLSRGTRYHILNATGTEVIAGLLDDTGVINMESLMPGVYILIVKKERNIVRRKILVR